MTKYKTVYFDLDHTLWDFEANARSTLTEMMDAFDLHRLGFESTDQMVVLYERINERLWVEYRAGRIDKQTLRKTRFLDLLQHVDHQDEELASRLNDHYVKECPHKTALIPGAIKVVSALSEKYPLHIISNGFEEAQSIKLSKTGLGKYFDGVFLSEHIGYQKPDPRIFEEVMNRTGADRDSSIYIGDHLDTDVIGANKARLDVVYFNPKKNQHDYPTTFEIEKLEELLSIL